jgi:hypothetical protein
MQPASTRRSSGRNCNDTPLPETQRDSTGSSVLKCAVEVDTFPRQNQLACRKPDGTQRIASGLAKRISTDGCRHYSLGKHLNCGCSNRTSGGKIAPGGFAYSARDSTREWTAVDQFRSEWRNGGYVPIVECT